MSDTLPPRTEYGTLRKTAFGRTNLFLTSSTTVFREIRCSATFNTRQASSSVFHTHQGNNSATKPEGCACWHCCHSFEGCGFRLPRMYDPNDNVYHVYGWLCSANCAKAYILEHSTFDRGYQMNIFVRMLREVYGVDDSVNESPPRTALKMFGGPFDIESFRSQKNVCFTVTPPFVSYCMLIEERQPISIMGEQPTTSQRGSVRGLRRPAQNTTVPQGIEDDICGPPSEGLYSEFLKRNGSQVTENSDSIAPSTKRLKTKSNVKPTSNTGLARFAANRKNND